MKKLIFVVLSVLIVGGVFGQSIEKNGRLLSTTMQGWIQTVTAQIFIEEGLSINLEHRDGVVFFVIIATSDHFTDIDSFEMMIRADRSITRYHETFDTINITAGRNSFRDIADIYSNLPNYFSREFMQGRYISRFEIRLPNTMFDVVVYAQEFTVSFSVSGQHLSFVAGPEEIRATQDAGLLMSLAGLR